MRWAVSLALGLAGCGAGGTAVPGTSTHPMRVMSLNQCTDQLVLAVLPPSRIASVTWLSRDTRYSAAAAAARTVPINHGGIEEVARAAPDLVVSDSFSNPTGRAMLHRLGYAVLELPDASDPAAIRANLRTLAARTGDAARGEALVAAFDRTLAAARVKRPWRVAAWGRDGGGEGPLTAALLRSIGLMDVSAPGDVETLLAARPDLLVTTARDPAQGSLGDARADQPIVRRRWPPRRRLILPEADLVCGGPAFADAARTIARQVDALR